MSQCTPSTTIINHESVQLMAKELSSIEAFLNFTLGVGMNTVDIKSMYEFSSGII
jgi:hypothetical protein